MQEELPPVTAPTTPETRLRDVLETLHRSPWATLPILDPETGHILATLSRPEPPRLGGMATPLGVYLHDGVSSGGAGFWGLFLTGVTMSGLVLLAQAGAHGLAREAAAHLPGLGRWEARLPPGFQFWLAAVSPWLPLPLVFLLMRLVPLSGTHAAEHQVVHCIERSAPLVPASVRAMPRIHPRCGTNLFIGFTLFLLTFLAVFSAATAGGWPPADAASLSVLLAAPVTLLFWRRVGGWFQQWFATRPATDAQIAGAIRAAEQVLARRRSWMERGMSPRFAWGRRLWAMGLAQLLLGYLAVYGLLSLAERLWPGLAGWVLRSNMIKEQLAGIIRQALEAAKADGELALETVPAVTLEMPKQKAHGDWATGVALGLARTLGMPPRDVAARIVSHLPIGDDALIAGAEIAGPGFINLRLRPDWLGDILRRVEAQGAEYGRSDAGGQKIVVEFVSTNPNGPITVAGGRNAAIGDTLCSLLSAAGNTVSREYYINDALNSVQMNNFGRSVFFRYRELLEHPGEEWEEMYRGDYVLDVAREVLALHGEEFVNADIDDPQTTRTFRDLSEKGMITQQKADLEAFGVTFDTWFSEATLHADGRVARAIESIKERGYTYEKDGALWFKSTAFGDDKDRVLVRSDGTPTYMTGDLAYSKDKLDRGFDRAINVWGADHAGYVARTKASLAALGYDPARLDVLLYQLVSIVKNGEVVMSSKRKGNILELKADLIDEIGKDAARFFFLMRSPYSALEIDVDLARKTEKDNPVYYVQYAHARIVQAIDKARAEKGVSVPAADEADLSLLTEDAETDLIKKLSELPNEVVLAAAEYAPQRIVQYARDLAAVFHSFYDAGNRTPALRVVCDDMETMKARLVLVHATQTVLRNVLALLGLSAPERM